MTIVIPGPAVPAMPAAVPTTVTGIVAGLAVAAAVK